MDFQKCVVRSVPVGLFYSQYTGDGARRLAGHHVPEPSGSDLLASSSLFTRGHGRRRSGIPAQGH